MEILWERGALYIRNSVTRLPFRYGKACLTRCPQAVFRAEILVDGKVHVGWSGDCLPPSWFDKSSGKDYAAQIRDMLAAIQLAERAYADCFRRSAPLFVGAMEVLQQLQQIGQQRDWPGLLSAFGASVVERAAMDAMARAAGVSFHQAIHKNLFGIAAEQFDQRLAGLTPTDWLPAKPRQRIAVRHTVGLADPLTSADICPEERVEDGQPQSLEQYLSHSGIRYLKVKVANCLEADLARLETIADLAERACGRDYHVTLDGNEQYARPEELFALFDHLAARPTLKTLWRNTLLVEQPMPRDVALDTRHADEIRGLARLKPLLIDEADQALDSFRMAVELGYTGVSSKNCKGPFKSLLNAGLVWWLNRQTPEESPYVMTGEDLCSVGIVPVQADLCLAATLGLRHVERNGHHYHPGLSYLPDSQQQQALEMHADFYHRDAGVVRPWVRAGEFWVNSLQCVGFGFAVTPDVAAYVPAAQWDFASLGWEEPKPC